MANNNPFDAALCARRFDPPFPDGEAPAERPGESSGDEVSARLRPSDPPAGFEAPPPRGLAAAAEVPQPPSQKLLPAPSPDAPSFVAATRKAKSISLTAALRQLPPATWPANLEPALASPVASRPPHAAAPPPTAPAAPRERPAEGRAIAGAEDPDHAASEDPPPPRHHDAAGLPLAFAVDPLDDETTAENAGFGGPSAAELAKRYAPSPPAAASVQRTARSSPEPRLDHGGNLRPIGRQASDEMPPASSRPQGGSNRTRKAAAVAVVLVGVMGGVGTVVALESLIAPKVAGGVASAVPSQTGALDVERPTAGRTRSVGKMITAAPVPASAVPVILAADTGDGVAAATSAEPRPLPGSAKVIPKPQPAPAVVDLPPTGDAGDRGGESKVAALDNDGVSPAPPVDAAPAGVAGDEPAADPGDATADGGDSPEAAPPRAPTPRPGRRGSPTGGGLAYAPAADLVDRGAQPVAGKGNDRPATRASRPAVAQVVGVNWVNMRAAADNRAAAVAALPAGSMVTVVRCASWCEIVADGRHGFVLKSFLRTTGAGARSAGGNRFRGGAPAVGNPYLRT